MLGSPDNGVPVLKTPSARQRRVVMPLVILAAVGLVALLITAAAGQRSTVVGSGSTLAQPLIERAATAFRDHDSADDPKRPNGDWTVDGSRIEYEPVGSMGGIMRLEQGEVDFAVSDYPLSQQALDDASIAQFPIAIGSIAVVHNAELPAGESLQLDASTISAIYRGQITRWNDAALQRINPGLKLPDEPIVPVHRQEGSGSTHGLTRWLTAQDRTWAEGPGSGALIDWPRGEAVRGSSGMVDKIQDTPWSIGYVETGQATREELAIAHLATGSGTYRAPSVTTMSRAFSDADWSGTDQYGAMRTAKGANVYPLTVPIYAMLKRDGGHDRETMRILGFLSYLMSQQGQSARELGYVPLPGHAADSIQDRWSDTFR